MSTERSAAPRAGDSLQRTLEQRRASKAWECVRDAKATNFGKEYGQLCRKAPADIQINGLGQTLAFWRAKGSENGQPKEKGNNAYWRLYTHLSQWVLAELRIRSQQALMDWITDQGTGVDDYRRATSEALAFLIWMKRFAEAELG